MNIIYGVLEPGLIDGLIALSAYLTLRVINFPDLTVNSSYTLGAAVTAALLTQGVNPYITTFCVIMAGSIAGSITAFLSVKAKIQNLLAGIIVMIGLYSINLRIMGKPNISIFGVDTIYSTYLPSMCFTLAIIVIAAAGLILFLLSEVGLGIRVSGQNKELAEAYGVSYKVSTFLVLALSNALVALSGSLFVQLQGFSDISMGNGIIVIGLVSVIIGERILMTRKIVLTIISCVVGAVIYKWAIAAALNIAGIVLKGSDMNLITAVLVVLIMVTKKKQYNVR